MEFRQDVNSVIYYSRWIKTKLNLRIYNTDEKDNDIYIYDR